MAADARIDSYIARQAAFARPILHELRRRVHDACPDCEETLKWGAPAFLHRGRQLAIMAAFKQHATFSFRHGERIVGSASADGAMGQFGRLTSLADLPASQDFAEMVRRAMVLAEAGPVPRPPAAAKPEIDVPADLRAALDAVPAAASTFDGFSPGGRREYVEWIVQARRPETRGRRLAQAIEWMAQGKKRNWKYERG